LINRIDEQIVFQPLGEDNVREILKTMLNEITEDVGKRYNIKIKVTEKAERFISQKGYSPEYGVRELRRTVEKLVQIPLSNLILSGKIKEQRALDVILRNEEIQIVPISEET
ncbi:MAG: ATP-dependent Clp protease ATP-binding subunit, partial [Nitrospirota bacterium]